MSRSVTVGILAVLPTIAKPAIEIVPVRGGEAIGIPMQILLILTALTLLPAVLVSLTPFLRIVVVLHFLRQALGTQSTPSNQVLTGLALFLTILLVQPTAMTVYSEAWQPLEKGELSGTDAWQKASGPVKTFLLKFAREKDLRLLVEITKAPPPRNPSDLDLTVIAPAYILSELKAGFQIGAVLFLPFLIIDLVIASLTLAVGMVQLPPALLSAPFKIMLFVLIDGWNLVIGSLTRSFG
jgi:flagellar biosynthesis protein FliP